MKLHFNVPAIIITGMILLACCNPTPTTQQPTPFESIIFKPFPPVELDSNATPEQLVSFAWNEFLALNWKSSYSSNGKRDYPNAAWSYASDSLPFPELVVRDFSFLMDTVDKPVLKPDIRIVNSKLQRYIRVLALRIQRRA